MKSERERGIQSITLKQVSIAIEVIVELKM